jgi:succinate dehydrogenase/fumarate reductase flavoprotein subunit
VDDLRRLMPDLTDEECARTDFGTYTEEAYLDDMGRVTDYRTDPDLAELLVRRSYDTLVWMRDRGIPLRPDLGPPGVPRRRQVQVLGRPHRRDPWRRPGPDRQVDGRRRQGRRRGALRRPRPVTDRR